MKKQIVEILTNGFESDVRVYKEAVFMKQLGYDVTILAWDREQNSSLPNKEIRDGLNVIRFRYISPAGRTRNPFKKIHAYFCYARECKKYIRTNQFDYIHCNDNSGAFVGCYAKTKKIPMVVDMHEFFEYGSRIRRYFMRKMNIYFFNHSIAALYENSAYLESPYKRVNTILYPLRNYPDSGMVKYSKKTKSSVFRIGFHGWIRSRMVEFVALFEAIKDMKNVRVDLNGRGPGMELAKQISARYSNVFVNGPFDGTKDLTKLYSNTDLLFCGYDPDDPNYQGDAEIVKFYEAIVTGTPMLMTESLGMGEKVKKNGWGVTCDTRDSEQIKNAILRIMNDKVFWEECSSRELISAPNYRWEEAVKVLEKIYPKIN